MLLQDARPKQNLTLSEYSEGTVELDPDALQRLRLAAGQRLQILPGEGRDRWIVRATQYVGGLATPDIQVLVRPKVPVSNLLLLLESDGKSFEHSSGLFDYATDQELLPAFATLFARRLDNALSSGASRSYVVNEAPLVTPRGRIDLAKQARTGWQPLPVECRFDEYEIDTPLNRLLAAAAQRMQRVFGVAAATRRSLGRSLQRLDGVRQLRTTDVLESHHFTRLDRHFLPAERLARLILSSDGLTDEIGVFSANAFFIDMNALFERFVSHRVARLLQGTFDVGMQHSVSLDQAGHVRMRPDLVLRRERTIVAVADIKYKITSDGVGKSGDYYQLLAYTTALRLQHGLLIYCQGTGDAPPREIIVRNSGQQLTTHAVQLDGSFSDIDEQMKVLACTLARLVEVSSGRLAAA